jgi:hypothetical protein
MKSALDGTATILPKAKQTFPMKVKLASRILAALKGERDPIQLRIAARLEVVDDQEDRTYSHVLPSTLNKDTYNCSASGSKSRRPRQLMLGTVSDHRAR